MTTRTLAEIDALCRKAARGRGCPWGLAEEAGKSARWLSSHGLDGPTAIAALLDRRACCMQGDGPRCALVQGAALNDRAADRGDAPCTVPTDAPLLILAQAGRAADALDRAFVLRWRGVTAHVARNALSLEQVPDEGPTTLTCTAVPTAPTAPTGTFPTSKARPVDPEILSRLTETARATLVPATEESRNSGAGSGRSDND